MSILTRARWLRKLIESMSASLPDDEALTAVELFPEWNPESEYLTDERVRFEGVLYKCLQSHSAQDAWTPADAPSLWAKVLIPDPDVIPEWVQPDSTNPYMKGDRVTHNGTTWESLYDNNVWEPGVFGWQEI